MNDLDRLTQGEIYENCENPYDKHCVKNVQIRSFFWSIFSCIRTEYGELLCKSPNLVLSPGKYGPEKFPYLDTFHAVKLTRIFSDILEYHAPLKQKR